MSWGTGTEGRGLGPSKSFFLTGSFPFAKAEYDLVSGLEPQRSVKGSLTTVPFRVFWGPCTAESVIVWAGQAITQKPSALNSKVSREVLVRFEKFTPTL